jgi:hypothetical protein
VANAGTFKKGQKRPGQGRPKGAVNKVTREFRDTVRRLLEDNAENVGRWLTIVAEGDGTEEGKPDPAKALDLMAKLAEFAAPKLGRMDLTVEDVTDRAEQMRRRREARIGRQAG